MEEKDVISVVDKITPEIEKMARKDVKSELGTGGMSSKIEAAKIATASGVKMIIANASRENVLTDIILGKNIGTTFVSSKGLNAKEKWILFGAVSKGEIIIDSGAVRAIREHGKSLLPAGIKGIKGQFKKDDVVRIKTEENEEIAKGIVSFSSNEIEKIMGKKSSEIEKILGSKSQISEVIHRDSLVLIPSLWK
jgi:glutamate 5-kinase